LQKDISSVTTILLLYHDLSMVIQYAAVRQIWYVFYVYRLLMSEHYYS